MKWKCSQHVFWTSKVHLQCRATFNPNQSDNHYHIADKAEEDKESEELDLTGLDDAELDKVIQFPSFMMPTNTLSSPVSNHILSQMSVFLRPKVKHYLYCSNSRRKLN